MCEGKEDWEAVRDALQDWTGPEREDLICQYPHLVNRRVWLNRWIKSCGGDLDRAISRILNHFRWRQEYGLDDVMDEDWSVFDARKELYVCGVDRDGTPTCYWNVSKHDPNFSTPEKNTRYLIASIERTWAVNPLSPNISFIIDCRGLSMSSYDHNMFNLCRQLIGEHYPENLRYVFVFPVNWVLRTITEMCRPFVHRDTLAKGRFLDENLVYKELSNFYDHTEIDQQFGGGLDLAAALRRRLSVERPRGASFVYSTDPCNGSMRWAYSGGKAVKHISDGHLGGSHNGNNTSRSSDGGNDSATSSALTTEEFAGALSAEQEELNELPQPLALDHEDFPHEDGIRGNHTGRPVSSGDADIAAVMRAADVIDRKIDVTPPMYLQPVLMLADLAYGITRIIASLLRALLGSPRLHAA